MNEFIAAYRDAVFHLHEHLTNIIRRTDIDTIPEEKWDEIRRNLCFFYEEAAEQEKDLFFQKKRNIQSNGNEAIFYFVSFNYTSFLDECIAKLAEKPLEIWKHNSADKRHKVESKVFHVHSPLNKYPIIGVSSEGQIANKDFQKNTLVRLPLVKATAIQKILRSNQYSKFERIIMQSDIICLWGVSIGDSDQYCWKKIIDWLRASNVDHNLFIFEHTDNPPNEIDVYDLYSKRRNVIQKICRHDNLSKDDFEYFMDKTHVIFNTQKVLAFPEYYDYEKIAKRNHRVNATLGKKP